MRISVELMRILTVLSVPMAIAAVFPYEAIGFRAENRSAQSSAVVAFVNLDIEAERNAIKTAKSTLRGETSRLQRLRADLSFGDIPEEPVRPVMPEPAPRASGNPEALVFGLPVYAPSAAADAPQSIDVAEPPTLVPAFSREEMLKIE